MANNDYEQLLLEMLEPVLTPVPVSTRRRDQAPFVRVRHVGGTALSRVHEDVLFTVEAYEATESAALRLDERARGYLLEKAPSVSLTRRVRVVEEAGAPVYLPDPERPDVERYSFTVKMRFRRQQTS